MLPFKQTLENRLVSQFSGCKNTFGHVYHFPLALFNVFINDIFLFIKHGQLYNYADDNTLSMSCPDFNLLIDSLVDDSKSLIEWFDFNCMQANPEKFQQWAKRYI